MPGVNKEVEEDCAKSKIYKRSTPCPLPEGRGEKSLPFREEILG